MTVLSVVGARPQFVKAFPVSKALANDHEEVLVHTGQHYDRELSEVFFEELDIPRPDYNLGIGSGTHARQTAELMQRFDTVVTTEAPDVVLVYGDTNSTLGAAGVARVVRYGLESDAVRRRIGGLAYR
jgi:UDP-N-acetylglucosamine 2-epimerase (non-hydrolysing)